MALRLRQDKRPKAALETVRMLGFDPSKVIGVVHHIDAASGKEKRLDWVENPLVALSVRALIEDKRGKLGLLTATAHGKNKEFSILAGGKMTHPKAEHTFRWSKGARFDNSPARLKNYAGLNPHQVTDMIRTSIIRTAVQGSHVLTRRYLAEIATCPSPNELAKFEVLREVQDETGLIGRIPDELGQPIAIIVEERKVESPNKTERGYARVRKVRLFYGVEIAGVLNEGPSQSNREKEHQFKVRRCTLDEAIALTAASNPPKKYDGKQYSVASDAGFLEWLKKNPQFLRRQLN